MRKIFTFSLLCFSFAVVAATSISSSTVSGHWTMSGSPYLIMNNITIDSASSLVIDPGVSVLFQGAYNLNVYGTLNATGTATQPISFNVNDTTGWWDATTTAGAWHGIQFQPYGGTGTDASSLQYCSISYTKFDAADALAIPEPGTLYIERSLSVSHCTITDNKAGDNFLMYVITNSGQVVDLNSCSVLNNSCNSSLILINSFLGGFTHLSGNSIYDNQSGNALISNSAVDQLFENNDVYNNNSVRGTISYSATTSLLTTKDCHATVQGNKIHHNTNTYNAALMCNGGFIDINGNLVCNNQHSSATCSFEAGGGGINIAYNSPGSFDSTFYTVRNNIIANNYSPFHGGGISIFDARAMVANNQIINNISADAGAIYLYDDFAAGFKNNIFYGNVSIPAVTSTNTPNIAGHSSTTVAYDHNWSEHNTLFDLDLGTSFSIAGDTTTNIMGADPLMVAPTLAADVTESALATDFSLTYLSPCINAGDTAGAYTLTTDYAGMARVISSIIDIGAYEFNPLTLGAARTAALHQLNIFPNPASTMISINCGEIIRHVSICNLLGQMIYSHDFQSGKAEVNVSALPSGVYIIAVNGTEMRKFVKE
jgi:hypothetical protein